MRNRKVLIKGETMSKEDELKKEIDRLQIRLIELKVETANVQSEMDTLFEQWFKERQKAAEQKQ